MSSTKHEPIADRIVVGDHDLHSAPRTLRDVADGSVIVDQFREPYDKKRLLVMTDVELLSVEWVLQFSIENDSKGTRTREEETEVGMTVTTGKEVSNTVSASAGFSGWGFTASVNGSTTTKTFTTVETSSVKRMKDTYICPPEASIFVYKRKYNFRCRVWFATHDLENWYENPESGKRIEAKFEHNIIANEELITPSALTDQGRIAHSTPPGFVAPTKGHPFEVWIMEVLSFYMGVVKHFPWINQ